MKAKQIGNEHVLVFEPGETVLETVNTDLTQRYITGTKFVAVGSFSRVQRDSFSSTASSTNLATSTSRSRLSA